MRFYVISDLHGDAEALGELVKHWDEENEKLVFIGDLCSRGSHSFILMNMVMELVKEEKAIWIKGNHEASLDEFLYEHTIYKRYLSGAFGGMQTIESFIVNLLKKGYSEEELGDMSNLVKTINKEYKELIDFISKLPHVFIHEDLMFVHAAVNLDTDNPRELSSHTLLWGEEKFYKNNPHQFNQIVIFGHMPTQNIGGDGDVLTYPCGKKIAIDGGGFLNVDSASINGIKIDSKNPKEIEVYRYFTVKKKLDIYKKSIVLKEE